MQKLIFVAEERHLNSPIPGGVQLCTMEYMELLRHAGFELIVFPIKHTRSIITRLKLKLGIEVYSRYEFNKYGKSIIKIAQENNVSVIALNQVDLIRFAPVLKNKLQCKIIVLSHGNESGDFLHEIIRSEYNKLLKIRDIIRLGVVVYMESKYFTDYIDVVVSVSGTEKQINNWLGAPKSIFIPRTYKPDFLEWTPILGRVGFVGTLNHKPNINGLILLLRELDRIGLDSLQFRIIGGPERIGKKLEEQYSFVKYMGFINDTEFRKEASTWSLFLNPIFWYSRGVTTKLAQAINWGLPILSTEPGNRGYDFQYIKPLTASSPSHMATLIKEKAYNPDYINELSRLTKQILESGPKINALGKEFMKIVEKDQ